MASCRPRLLAGGFALPPVLGSVSTHVRTRLGGLDGRPLKPGDVLPLHDTSAPDDAGPHRATPMRRKAFGEEPPGSLLESREVAVRSIDVLLSNETGLSVDIRRDDPLAGDSDSV